MEGHTKTQEHFKNRRRRSIWNRAVTGMAAVVVFCTTYALILPAITMERSPTCGIEEHAHDDGCYTPPLVLSCGAETSGETLLHTHNEFCYDADKNLICPLPELQAHTHGDSCYTVIEPQPLHVHEEGCWKEKKVLACGLEETEGHSHTDSCDGQTENLICQMEQSQGHAHAGECYDDAGTLICGQEEAPGHTHGPECYEIQTVRTCGLEEQAAHQHIDTCYETEKELICGLEEATEEQLASPPSRSGSSPAKSRS